jgi:hypothetical protein
MPAAPTAAKVDLLDLLGVVGGPKALEGVARAARDDDEEVQGGATRVLGEWMSADAAPVLLELAENSPSKKFQIRALRGYIRIARQLNLTTDQRIAMCREAMQVADRNEEKRLVLETLGRTASADALALATAHLDDPGLKEAAGAAAVSISGRIVGSHASAVKEAMTQVLEATAAKETKEQAEAVLDKASK